MTRKPPSDAVPFDEEIARRIARIMGVSSGAAQALANIEMLKNNNIEYVLMHSEKTNGFFVFYANDQTNPALLPVRK